MSRLSNEDRVDISIYKMEEKDSIVDHSLQWMLINEHETSNKIINYKPVNPTLLLYSINDN